MEINKNTVNRSALAIVLKNKWSYTRALSYLEGLKINLICGDEISVSLPLQAALITAINTGKRAFLGGVEVYLPNEGIECLLPTYKGITLAELIIKLGGHLLKSINNNDSYSILFGMPAAYENSIQIVCNDWQGGFLTYVSQPLWANVGKIPLGGIAAGSIGIGTGIGEHAYTADVLEELLLLAKQPLVIDASALNILANHPQWMQTIPPNSILTPHPRELERLAGIKFTNSWERLHKTIEMAKRMQVIIVLKGAYTAVVFPNGTVHFNSTGNSGLATAGSGDVLTGIITSLLAQGYIPEEAALIGVFAHGYAGDKAAVLRSKAAMIASDIVEHLQEFFLDFE